MPQDAGRQAIGGLHYILSNPHKKCADESLKITTKLDKAKQCKAAAAKVMPRQCGTIQHSRQQPQAQAKAQDATGQGCHRMPPMPATDAATGTGCHRPHRMPQAQHAAACICAMHDAGTQV